MSDVLDVFKHLRKHILAGVSYLIPVVVVGGIFAGLGVMFGGTAPWEAPGTAGYFLFMLGKQGLNLMPAVIAAYIGYSIGDKAAIGPGLIIGQVAQATGAGFLGGLLAGLYVGIFVMLLKKVKIHSNFRALWQIIFIPSVVTVIGAYGMEMYIGSAVSGFIAWLTTVVESLGTGNMVILGIAIGLIGAFDLGLFGSKAQGAVFLAMLATIDPATGMPVMIAQRLLLAGATASTLPPLIAFLATVLKPKVFTAEERESGKAALFLGMFAITEGAIPLALSDKIVYAGCILGAMVGCTSILLLGPGTIVNWGGLPTLPGVTNVPLALIAWAIGIVAGAMFIVTFKKTSNADIVAEEGKDATVESKGLESTLKF